MKWLNEGKLWWLYRKEIMRVVIRSYLRALFFVVLPGGGWGVGIGEVGDLMRSEIDTVMHWGTR